jgi:hypothetical protein
MLYWVLGPVALFPGTALRVLLGWNFSAIAEIQAEMGFAAGAGDFEGKLGSSPVFVEKGIDRLQKNGLPTRSHLGKLGVHPELAVEVECVAIQTVPTFHIRMCSGDLKVEK